MRKKKLTEEQITKIKAVVKNHYHGFETEKIDKQKQIESAEPYADVIYKTLTHGEPPIFGRDTNAKIDIGLLKLREDLQDSPAVDVLNEILADSNRIKEWHIAVATASLFILNQAPMPPTLADFSVNILQGKRQAPRTRHSIVANRDNAIFSCIHWIVTSSEIGIKERLGIPGNIGTYTSEWEEAPTACRIVKDALNEIGIPLSNAYVNKIWRTYKPKP
jgi:hypothetical protein